MDQRIAAALQGYINRAPPRRLEKQAHQAIAIRAATKTEQGTNRALLAAGLGVDPSTIAMDGNKTRDPLLATVATKTIPAAVRRASGWALFTACGTLASFALGHAVTYALGQHVGLGAVLLLPAVRPVDGRGGRRGERALVRDALLRPTPGSRAAAAGSAAPSPTSRSWSPSSATACTPSTSASSWPPTQDTSSPGSCARRTSSFSRGVTSSASWASSSEVATDEQGKAESADR
ncbi:uncharacterized protein LOC125555559 [Triticum urartu]|uniref:uncharacterized protein LOC125555559 n=1 Tax=Triticum urartu TaxID=4572 RepID=UPI0020444658|nr:uncharacterized protein LOC125555559 [Triticum urartu]